MRLSENEAKGENTENETDEEKENLKVLDAVQKKHDALKDKLLIEVCHL